MSQPARNDTPEPTWLPGPTTVPRGVARADLPAMFVADMVNGALSEAEVCARHKVDWLDWLHIKTTPQWQETVTAARELLEPPPALSYADRCRSLRDSSLPVMAEILHDGSVSPAVRHDVFKTISAGAHDGQAGRSDKPMFALQINFGDRTVDIAGLPMQPE